ncbi:hypothetical protein TNCV_2650281 [Trichonephila clavipes]|nr:hypothetical protein TNCV_2650281 [Trichonephila clavipes]
MRRTRRNKQEEKKGKKEVNKKKGKEEVNKKKEEKPQCDKLKKNHETVASNETVRNETDVLAPYTSLGTVNGIEMPILRDTGATLDLICKNT